jgi:NADPH:quinone reductase-like Zn-dependent oxidoreductase
MASPGATAGTDCAGVVVAIGDTVPPGQFAIGDRVCAPVTPMNPLAPQDGAFAEYVAITADFALKIPAGISLDSASALGIAVATAGYALFESLQLPGHPEKPATTPAYVFVYGGSTASGTMAIQLLKR